MNERCIVRASNASPVMPPFVIATVPRLAAPESRTWEVSPSPRAQWMRDLVAVLIRVDDHEAATTTVAAAAVVAADTT